MPGLTSCLRLGRLERTIGLAIAAMILLSIWAPSAAHASGCTNTWTHTAEGSSASWFEAGNWSKGKVPSGEEEACITEKGTYTVLMTQTTGTVSVKALTVGATSGTQTMVVGSSCSLNAILTTTSGISLGKQGAMTLTNGDGCGDGVKLIGPIASAGTITIEPAHGGARELQGALTNTGTLAINANTAYNGASTLLTNEATLNVAENVALAVSNASSVTNGAGGTITAAGSEHPGDVSLSGGTFTEGAGTTSGVKPVIVDDGALAYTGAGASLIALHGEKSTLSGTSSTGQSLSIESTCGENVLTTASGFTNGGSITLTNGDGCGNNVTLDLSAGTLTNTGTITSEPLHGGARTLQGNIANKGTIAINGNTAYNGLSGALANEGAIDVAEGKALTVSNSSSVTNGAGGKIAGGASGVVAMEPATSFTQGAGTTSGTLPVVVRDAALTYSGAGASTIATRGESSTLSGNLSSGQALLVQSTCGENATTTAAASFSSGGSVTLTNGDGCGDNVRLVISAGTLTNTGTITTEPAIAGARTLAGSIDNKGTLAINANTAYNGVSALLTNEGALNIATAKMLTVTEKGAVVNGAGGKIAGGASGVVAMEPATSFTQGAGTTSGMLPVIVRDGSVTYSGSGASTIATWGESSTLSGNLSSGQTLSIQSTCGEHAKTTAAASFTSGGSITLTNGSGCGNNAALVISAGTLTNTGTITTEVAVAGARTLAGSIDNKGTIAINANTAYNGVSALLTNEGAIDVAEGKALTVSNDGSIINGSGGKIAAGATGAVLLEPGSSFTEGLGTTSGALPVIIRDGALIYTGKGASTIALRGEGSTLSGTINSGQTLSIQSTCGEHAKTTAAAGFINSGTIKLTNGDGCGNNATLNLAGATLENKGTIDVEEPHGGSRAIEGSIESEKTVSLSAGANLNVTGTYVQGKKGTLKTAIASGSSYGVLSATGTASIGGTLTLVQAKTFLAKAGESFAILSSAGLTGTFAKETADSVKKTAGLYYKPTYSATGVTLVVTLATVSLSSAEGAPGSIVTVTGSGFVPGDTIKLTFTDHKKAKTTFPSAVANGSGEFSTEVTVPVGAAEGSATIIAKSTEVGVSITKTFKVT